LFGLVCFLLKLVDMQGFGSKTGESHVRGRRGPRANDIFALFLRL
jgi:hypothetical protein